MTLNEIQDMLYNTELPCCYRDDGGSHYHCGTCNEIVGMMGHQSCKKVVEVTEFTSYQLVALLHICLDGLRSGVDVSVIIADLEKYPDYGGDEVWAGDE